MPSINDLVLMMAGFMMVWAGIIVASAYFFRGVVRWLFVSPYVTRGQGQHYRKSSRVVSAIVIFITALVMMHIVHGVGHSP